MLMLLIAATIIGIASSTVAQRRDARQRFRRWSPVLWVAAAAIWAVMLAPW